MCLPMYIITIIRSAFSAVGFVTETQIYNYATFLVFVCHLYIVCTPVALIDLFTEIQFASLLPFMVYK